MNVQQLQAAIEFARKERSLLLRGINKITEKGGDANLLRSMEVNALHYAVLIEIAEAAANDRPEQPTMGPTYYVRHPDDTYSVANPQPTPSPGSPQAKQERSG